MLILYPLSLFLLFEASPGSPCTFPIPNETPELVKSEFWSSMFLCVLLFLKKFNTSYKFYLVIYLACFSAQSIFPPFDSWIVKMVVSSSDFCVLLAWPINVIELSCFLSQQSRAHLPPSLLEVLTQISTLGVLLFTYLFILGSLPGLLPQPGKSSCLWCFWFHGRYLTVLSLTNWSFFNFYGFWSFQYLFT